MRHRKSQLQVLLMIPCFLFIMLAEVGAFIVFILFDHAPAPRIILLVLMVLLLASYIQLATSDPGLMPSKTSCGGSNVLRLSDGTLIDTKPEQWVRDIQVSTGSSFMVFRRFMCYTCNTYRTYRTVHCSECNACVLEKDHHCVFLGNCIGRNNRRLFVLWLMMIVMLWAWVSALLFWNSKHGWNFYTIFAYGSAAMALIFLSFLSTHFYLAAYDMTTREQVNGYADANKFIGFRRLFADLFTFRPFIVCPQNKT